MKMVMTSIDLFGLLKLIKIKGSVKGTILKPLTARLRLMMNILGALIVARNASMYVFAAKLFVIMGNGASHVPHVVILVS